MMSYFSPITTALVQLVMQAASEETGIPLPILENSRKRDAAITRMAVVYTLIHYGHGSVEGVGAALNRHHTTVMYARDTAVKHAIESPQYAMLITVLRDVVRRYYGDSHE